jgi:hypothetical protein
VQPARRLGAGPLKGCGEHSAPRLAVRHPSDGSQDMEYQIAQRELAKSVLLTPWG